MLITKLKKSLTHSSLYYLQKMTLKKLEWGDILSPPPPPNLSVLIGSKFKITLIFQRNGKNFRSKLYTISLLVI